MKKSFVKILTVVLCLTGLIAMFSMSASAASIFDYYPEFDIEDPSAYPFWKVSVKDVNGDSLYLSDDLFLWGEEIGETDVSVSFFVDSFEFRSFDIDALEECCGDDCCEFGLDLLEPLTNGSFKVSLDIANGRTDHFNICLDNDYEPPVVKFDIEVFLESPEPLEGQSEIYLSYVLWYDGMDCTFQLDAEFVCHSCGGETFQFFGEGSVASVDGVYLNITSVGDSEFVRSLVDRADFLEVSSPLLDKIYTDIYGNGYNKGFEDGVTSSGSGGSFVSGFEYGKVVGREEGYEEGYDVGYEKGNTTGYDLGRTDGYNSGYREGHMSGYDSGYEEGHIDGSVEGYNAGYSQAEDEFDEILHVRVDEAYDNGYTIGYGKGAAASDKDSSAFSGMVFSLFDAPVQLVGSMLDFNIFGINMFSFVRVILTACMFGVVAMILIKIFMKG